MPEAIAPVLVWFRRDLRLDDQPALAAALASGRPIACAFCLDPAIFGGADASAPRVAFLLDGLRDLDQRLRDRGGGLIVCHGESVAAIRELAAALDAAAVHACADAEPFALERDARASRALRAAGRSLTLHHDLTVIEHDRATNADGSAPQTYSAYARAVRRALAGDPVPPQTLALDGRLRPVAERPAIPAAAAIGIEGGARSDLAGGETAGLARLRWWRDSGRLAAYAGHRDEIADPDATSRLSRYLKLGMLSPRRCLAVADEARASKWAAELLWRDWFKLVLHRHPDLADEPVDERYGGIEWPGTDSAFDAWTRGETGYGLVDAGMRQLAETGFMPNRVRMVCASFATKDLHIAPMRGERWFRERLVDGDLAANAGSWWWVAGGGLDAAPYFRVFNPTLQERRFDADGAYVRRWAPDRPAAIVDHDVERLRTLERYRTALGGAPTRPR